MLFFSALGILEMFWGAFPTTTKSGLFLMKGWIKSSLHDGTQNAHTHTLSQNGTESQRGSYKDCYSEKADTWGVPCTGYEEEIVSITLTRHTSLPRLEATIYLLLKS